MVTTPSTGLALTLIALFGIGGLLVYVVRNPATFFVAGLAGIVTFLHLLGLEFLGLGTVYIAWMFLFGVVTITGAVRYA